MTDEERTDEERIGAAAMNFIDHFRREYGDNAKLEVVAVVGAVGYERGGERHSEPTFFCEDGRRWVQHGLLTVAAESALSGEHTDGEDDE